MADIQIPDLDSEAITSNELARWALDKPDSLKPLSAETIFSETVKRAARHKSLSGNACVRLCGFVTLCARSDSAVLREWAFSPDLILRITAFYLEWNETDEHRSMKLVLDLVAILLSRSPSPDAARDVKTAILDDLVSVISGTTTKPVAKSAIKMVDHLLAKSVLGLGNLAASYGRITRRSESVDPRDPELWDAIMLDLFGWMKLPFVCPPAGRLAVTLHGMLLAEVAETGIEAPGNFSWSRRLHALMLSVTTAEPSLLPAVQNYVYLPLFRHYRSAGLCYLAQMEEPAIGTSAGADADPDAPALLRLTALQVAKKAGLLSDEAMVAGNAQTGKATAALVPMPLIAQVLCHASTRVRALALSLVVSSASTTKPFPPGSFGLLQKHLGAYFADPEAQFRNEVVGLMKDMFRRLRATMFALQKVTAKLRGKEGRAEGSSALREAETALTEHQDFLTWFLGLLKAELVPTASYQRHFTSLRVLGYVIRLETDHDKTWDGTNDADLFFGAFDESWSRALLDLLMDPFEDVRSLSSTILDRIFSDVRFRGFVSGNAIGPALAGFLDRAEGVATWTSRADHGDGVARASRLLFRYCGSIDGRMSLLGILVAELDNRVCLSESDLGRAVVDAPVHGNFASLCQIWQSISEAEYSPEVREQLSALCKRIVSCCRRSWFAVRAILCDDSPEGHLPLDLEETDGLGTKELLSYSFRATHEASNLMKAIVLAAKKQPQKPLGVRPPLEIFRQIGDLAFEQLSSLRHRGALGTVALTFTACCQMTSTIEGPCEDGRGSLLGHWYEGALNCVWNLESTTRRSAGIPAIIIGILSANATTPSFDTVLQELVRIAGIKVRLGEKNATGMPQVHAHNCLREIFKSSMLTGQGNKSEKYISPCVDLAAGSLESEIWAVRNCGLLLLRSLIDCLFGTTEAKSFIEAGWDGKATRIHYHKYPSLPGVLVSLLRGGRAAIEPGLSNTRGAESVFPALDIIRRAGPPEAMRLELQGYVTTYLGSKVWHVREMAARTLCSCLLHDGWMDAIDGILQRSLADTGSNGHNGLHGAYLALKFVLEKMADVLPAQIRESMGRLGGILHRINANWPAAFRTCPDILAAHVEVANLVLSLDVRNDTGDAYVLAEPILARISSGTLLAAENVSPLFRTQAGKLLVLYGRATKEPGNLAESLAENIIRASQADASTACAMLDTLAAAWPLGRRISGAGALCRVYLAVCLESGTNEPRVTALEHLVTLCTRLIEEREVRVLPRTEQLTGLWNRLCQRPLNPSLGNAILKLSGLVAGQRSRDDASYTASPEFAQWGVMVADAGKDDRDFDTRMAAVISMRAFVSDATLGGRDGDGKQPWPDAWLPVLMALYGALNDDDEEIRVAAAAVAAQHPTEPIEAAHEFLHFLEQKFSVSPCFLAIVTRRLAGVPAPGVPDEAGNMAPTTAWEPAASRLERARRADDTLFMVEEQNLFADEAREAQRWARVLRSLPLEAAEDDPNVASLRSWALEGLGCLVRLCRENGDDGPLGWTAKPEVFAVCVHVVVSASALARARPGDEEELEVVLAELRDAGTKARLSGLLLDMMDG